MTGKERRQLMDEAIKTITLPFIRNEGFSGSYPHFRRIKDDRINLLTFQFSQSSPKFVVEISNCSPEGIDAGWGEPIKPYKCEVGYMSRRLRVGSIMHKTDYWFDFSKESIFGNIYKKRAKEVIDLWAEAELWWHEDPQDQRNARIPI